MSLQRFFGTNKDDEQDGIWQEFPDYGFRVKLARVGSGNPQYMKALEKRTKPIRRQLSAMSADAQAKIILDVFARVCVKGWDTKNEDGDWVSGIAFVENQPLLPFSPENVVMVFTELPDMYEMLLGFASDANTYKDEVLAADVGN